VTKTDCSYAGAFEPVPESDFTMAITCTDGTWKINWTGEALVIGTLLNDNGTVDTGIGSECPPSGSFSGTSSGGHAFTVTI
jgi:hypothetical protein